MQKPGGRRTWGCLQQGWGNLWSFVNLVAAIISILKKYNQRLNKILKKIRPNNCVTRLRLTRCHWLTDRNDREPLTRVSRAWWMQLFAYTNKVQLLVARCRRKSAHRARMRASLIVLKILSKAKRR